MFRPFKIVNMKLKSVHLTLLVQLIVQFCLIYCQSGVCASLSLSTIEPSGPDNGGKDLISSTTSSSSASNDANHQISLHTKHLQDTFGHDPFVYSWFNTDHVNYQVEMMIRDLFRKSMGILNDELLEVFLAGMFASPSTERRIMMNQKVEIASAQAQGTTTVAPSAPAPDNVFDDIDLVDSISICPLLGRDGDSGRYDPETNTTEEYWDESDVVPDGCYFYTGDMLYKNYLVCDKSTMKEIPRIPDTLDIFEMNSTIVECIRPNTFAGVQVQFVRLNQNRILGASSTAFQNVRGLKHLVINQNQLKLPIWFSAFDGLEELELLEMENNKISMDRILRLGNGDIYNKLKEDNHVDGDGPFLTSIKYISLKSNPIGFIPSFFFARFHGSKWLLLTIILSGCNLYDIEPDAFSHFKKIYLLELSENPDLMSNLTTAAAGLAAVNIEKLALSYNSLQQVPTVALAVMNNSLASLDLRGNSFLQIFDESFPEMPKLTSLNLDSCQLSSISLFAFKHLPKLDTLSLKGNKLTTVPPALASLPNLATLVLSNNNDEKVNKFSIPAQAFANLNKLKSLFMNEIKLKSLSATTFEGLVKLQLLHMTSTLLESIEDGTFLNVPALQFLDMGHNKLKGLNSETFLGLKNLNSLYMPGCELSFPTKREDGSKSVAIDHRNSTKNRIRHRKSLSSHSQKLVLNPKIDFVTIGHVLNKLLNDSYNEREEDEDEEASFREPFRHLHRLRYLFLSDNKITELHPELFENLPYLHSLDLNRNLVQAWPASAFKNNTVLEELRLSGNSLVTITEEMLRDFEAVYTNIDLTENPFLCDVGVCDLKSGAGNRSFVLHDWVAAPNRHLCYETSQKRVQIRSLSDGYCEELWANPTGGAASTTTAASTAPSTGETTTTTIKDGTGASTTTTTTESPASMTTTSGGGNDSDVRADDDELVGAFSIKTIVIVASAVVAVIAISFVAYKKRLHLKYFWFDARLNLMKGRRTSSGGSKLIRKSGRSRRGSAGSQSPEFEYDVFISYSHHDSEFIQDSLVPMLEGTGKFFVDEKLVATSAYNSAVVIPGQQPMTMTTSASTSSMDSLEGGRGQFKVCLHERDFEVGTAITENIIECVDHSKKVVIVVSRKYLESQWCLFEMNLAYHRLVEVRRKSFLVILLEDIPAELRTKVLNYLMKSTTYLQWPGSTANAADKKIFWARLRHSLKTTVV